MAAKLLHSLADDNPDLQKQIGCMTGVFQIFDRHHIVPGRRFPGHSPKRLPPGSPQIDNGTPESESSNSYHRPYIVDKHSNKIVQDKHRASTESSRDSFSSMSRSSSFSSLDCNVNRTTHPEPDPIVFPETPLRDSLTRQSCGSRQSLDLRDVVKDSMYREARGLDTLPKFQDSNWYHNEPREFSRSKSYHMRDGSSFSIPKDCPRFSYDGRESNRLSEPTTSKQVEELPRLSLDSRESSIRSLNLNNSRNPKSESPIQSRPPSVVAKLMGLETLPDSKEFGLGPIRTTPVESTKTSKRTDLFGPIKMQNSPREPTSPLWKNADMKPISRFPIEPAPWKQRDGGARSPQRPGSPRVMKSPTKIHSPYSSVYGEVDKRLKDIQFTQSGGKDLRALKHILEAMQAMEARKEGTQVMVKRHPITPQNERFHQNPSPNRGYESPIVIMKPGKLVERSGMHVAEFSIDDRKIFRVPKSTRRENGGGGGRHTRTATPPPPSLPPKQQHLTKQNGTTTGSISPRLQQKRLELDRRSRPPTPPPDSGKPRKQLTRQLSDSTSPGGRRRPKYSNIQQTDDQYREESKKFTGPESSEEIDNRQSPSSIQEKSSLIRREDESNDPEYPSPVSVLDDVVYMDDSPSPVKHMMKTLKDENFVKEEWEAPPEIKCSGITSEINRKKLQNIENLVQKLTRLNSTHDEAHTDYIASLCENTKPDDRYISEILLASGLLLRDLTSFQFHSSGHPINPELFLVLEQTKKDPEKQHKKEKLHRKMIFDAVNEVLAGKLGSVVPSLTSFKVVKKTLNGQKLLRELCLEIEELQVRKKKEDVLGGLDEGDDDGFKGILWEEVLNRGESWTDYDGELPVISLEVERLIFKDLVNEVVLGEAADGKRIKAGRRCRKLFSK